MRVGSAGWISPGANSRPPNRLERVAIDFPPALPPHSNTPIKTFPTNPRTFPHTQPFTSDHNYLSPCVTPFLSRLLMQEQPCMWKTLNVTSRGGLAGVSRACGQLCSFEGCRAWTERGRKRTEIQTLIGCHVTHPSGKGQASLLFLHGSQELGDRNHGVSRAPKR